ncbi:nuclear transport factor 2 family protein [Erythrobacter donghaensis]|jgi:hypothetical protein|uniref:nuclear transport factor 2 family protein n=1 Tax=Erythrobacter donghaensis TaxID=267135 RepID=UPI0009392F87|nr:nuclear transport factor 2 family protein [Erythrobacter donghaensis]
MTIELPSPIAGYFAADRSDDIDAFLRCFAGDAIVIDERRTHAGHDQIREWKTKASAQYTYHAAPYATGDIDGQTIVTAHLTGDFPGSPVDLRYAFTLCAGLIARLEIKP